MQQHSHIKAMDLSSPWLSELEMQDQGFMNQYQMIKPYHHLVADFSIDSFSSESNTENPSSVVGQAFQIPATIKQTAANNSTYKLPSYKSTNSSTINKKFTPIPIHEKPKTKPLDVPNTFTISFGDLKPKDEVIPLKDPFGNYTIGTKKVPTMIRNRIQLQDHMLAERKRREKLARRFISLSALLPDLKKMDKATVLEDAANYIQELQNRVKELEGLSDSKTKNNMQSGISAKRSKLTNEGGSSSDEANFGESHSTCSPEIEVKMSGSSVLVRIYCRKNHVSLVKVLSEMQKLGLSITSSTALPFANTTLLMSIVAEKKDDFSMTSTDLVKTLQLAI